MTSRRNQKNLDLNSTGGKLFLGLFFLVGIGLIAGGSYRLYETQQFQAIAAAAAGEVVELKYSRGTGSNSSGTYYPIVRWHSPDGTNHKFRGDFGSYPAAYSVGEQVEVLYDPQNYGDARISGAVGLWGTTIIMFVIGAMFVGVSALLVHFAGNERKKREWLRRHGRSVRAEVLQGTEALSPAQQKILNFVVEKGLVEQKTLAQSTSSTLCARWTDPKTSQEHMFQFPTLSAAKAADAREKGYIYVYINPKNPADYIAESELRAPR